MTTRLLFISICLSSLLSGYIYEDFHNTPTQEKKIEISCREVYIQNMDERGRLIISTTWTKKKAKL